MTKNFTFMKEKTILFVVIWLFKKLDQRHEFEFEEPKWSGAVSK